MKKIIYALTLALAVACGGPDGVDRVNPPVDPPITYEPYVPPEILNDPSGGGNCVAPETPVLMADGTTKPAGEVVVGDYVLARQTYASLSPFVPKMVVATTTYESNTRVKVVFKDGYPSMVTTAKHRVLVYINAFTEVGLLTPGTGVFGITTWDHMDMGGPKPVAVVDHLEAYPDGPATLIQIEGSEWISNAAYGYFTNGVLSYDPPE